MAFDNVDVFKFELVGLDQLLKNMGELPTVAMKKTVVRNALKKALVPVLDASKQAAPRGPTGNLQRGIKISTKLKPSQRKGKPRDRTTVTMYVGSTMPHAHLVEFGTKERTLKSPVVAPIGDGVVTVQTTGRMPANPFLRNAWDSKRGQLLPIFAAEMKIQLEKAAARLAKRAGAGTLTKSQVRGLGG